jgi:hypothetical protein
MSDPRCEAALALLIEAAHTYQQGIMAALDAERAAIAERGDERRAGMETDRDEPQSSPSPRLRR